MPRRSGSQWQLGDLPAGSKSFAINYADDTMIDAVVIHDRLNIRHTKWPISGLTLNYLADHLQIPRHYSPVTSSSDLSSFGCSCKASVAVHRLLIIFVMLPFMVVLTQRENSFGR